MALANYDGEYIEKKDIKISLGDLGFSRGLAFFETMRVYGGAPFHMKDHIERMQSGAAAFGLSLPLPEPQIEKIVLQIILRNKFQHSTVKFYFTAGEASLSPYSMAKDHGLKPHIIIVEDEVKPDHPEAPYGLDLYKRGLRIKITPYERILPKVKSINYLQAYYASREAGEEWDDVLFTHREGYVTEATRSNFFCVIDGVLCTPDKDILDGVTRKVVLEIANELKIPFTERRITPLDIKNSNEAFTTGSFAEMVPVSQIDDHKFLSTMDGPIFSKIRKGFNMKIEESSSAYYAAEKQRHA